MVNQNVIDRLQLMKLSYFNNKKRCNHWTARENSQSKTIILTTIFSDLLEKVIDLLKGYKCNHSRRYNSDEIGFETFVKPT